MLDQLPGVYYTEHVLPLKDSSANTAYEAVCPNPFDSYAYVYSIEFIPIEALTGDNTNSFNLNADLVAGTEIANLDFPTGVDGVKGVKKAFTFTGTAAQRKIAADGSILIEREEVGTQPAHIYGSKVVVGWKAAGL